MEKLLRKEIEELVNDVLGFTLNDSRFEVIIITDSKPNINDFDRLNMNYTYDRFLDKQPVIDKRIKVKLIYPYNFLKNHREGHYVLYVNEYLKPNRLKSS